MNVDSQHRQVAEEGQNSMSRPFVDKQGKFVCSTDWSDLENLYTIRRLTLKEIAALKNCRDTAVWSALRRLNIPIRSRSESTRAAWANERYKSAIRRGADSAAWRGGRRRDARGYIYIYSPNHPYATKAHCVMEHRLVVEEELGRYLLPSEKVHHKNKIKNDNRPENLEVFSCQAAHLTTITPLTRLDKLEAEMREVKKENRLLRWQIKELQKQLQYKLEESE